MEKLLPLILLLFLNTFTFGQKTISGQITDQNNESLIGVNITVKGIDGKGTLSDFEGKYNISVTEGQTLVFSYIGYLTKEVTVGSANTINIVLAPNSQLLDEVVVVGYGTSKRADLTGAVASVTGEELRNTLTTNIDQALQGRVAGVQITQNSGQPGGAASIRIRGANSISLSSEPLYVIDGLPFQGDGASTIGFDWAGGANGQNRVNPLSTINPADILSIDVLKDASATAIYGSRGANGVIIITTKRGKKGESKISYNTYYGSQTLRKKLDMMSLREFADYNNQITPEVGLQPDPRFADPSLLGSGTNWQNEIFRTAGTHSHQLSIVGGNDRTNYAITGGFMTQDGIVIGSDFNRKTVRINLDNKVKDWFKVGASLAFAKTAERITLNDGRDGVIAQALISSPTIAVRDIEGNFDGPENRNNTGFNPVAAALQRNNTLHRQRLMANVFGDLLLHKNLVFRSEFSFDNNHGFGKAFQPTFKWGVLENLENRLRQREENSFFWATKNYVTFDKKFNDQHSLVVMAGTEAQRSDYSGSTITVANLPSNDIQEIRLGKYIGNPDGWKGASSLLSYYSRANYNFSEKFLATFTYRADASSNFGPNRKWGFFPSGSLAWRVSQHDFLKDNNTITNLKLRLGYGLSGNQAIPAGLFEPLMQTIRTPFGNAFRPQNIANPSLGWETTAQLNAGIDISLIRNRIDLVIDVYDKTTKDMLLQTFVPGYIGGSGWMDIAAPFINVGKMSNKGIDIGINSKNIVNKNFTWSSDINVSVNRNKVLELDSPDKVYYRNLYWYSEFQTATVTRVGQPIGMFWGYVSEGIFKNEEDILNHAVQISDKVVTDQKPHGSNLVNKRQGIWVGDVKFKDINGDGIINTDDQTYIGNPNPDFTFGINNSVTYKSFDFGIFVNGAYGVDILNYTKVILEGQTGIWNNQLKSVFDRAQYQMLDPNGSDLDPKNVVLANEGTNIARPTTNDNNRNNRMSDRLIEDGSYIRLQNIKFGYTLPTSLTRKAKIDRLKIYANLQNIAVFTKYTGYDPEIGAFNQSALLQNVDMGRYPNPRMITFGIDVDF